MAGRASTGGVEGEGEGHREHDHLQDLAVHHGLHRVARHQVAQHAGQGGDSAMPIRS